ncbi:MAG: molybdenum cofactor guanylyltransferase [Coriobacteriales bacterium]|jgi:molybdopterin-guanine dinucleotide biosynthesis protein A|nr:molybdenum cofactor guanylyltransferase [Coriobacteriales bacterium]
MKELEHGLTVVIQAGGESKRMGSPKALVSFCGLPLICRGLKRVGAIADELIITSNDQQSLDFLCTSVKFNDKLRLHADVLNVRGALTGLYTALHYATKPFVGVVACDMLFPSAPLLLAQRDVLLADPTLDVAVPVTSHGFEPFHAVYRRESCLPLVKEALDAGQTRATSWFPRAHLYEFTHEMALAVDPRGGFFINVNTPEELTTLEARILSGSITKLSDRDCES